MIAPNSRINCPLDRAGRAARDLLAVLDWRVSIESYEWGYEVVTREPLTGGLELVWRVAQSVRGDSTALSASSLWHIGAALDAVWRPRVLAAVAAAWGLDEQAVAL